MDKEEQIILNQKIDTAEKTIIRLAKEISMSLSKGDLSILDKEKEFAEALKIFFEKGLKRDVLTARFSDVVDHIIMLKDVLTNNNLAFSCLDEFLYEYSVSFLKDMSEKSRRINGEILSDDIVVELDAVIYNRVADGKCEYIDSVVMGIINKMLSSESLALLKSESLKLIVENISMILIHETNLSQEDKKKIDIFFKYIESLCRIGKDVRGYSKILIAHESPIINGFVQLFQMGKIPEGYQDWAEYLMSYKLEKKFLKKPDMSIYDEFIDNKISIPKELKKDFLNDISILGFLNGIIPTKYTEYLIGQMLDNESSLYRMSPNQRASIFSSFARARSKNVFGRDIFILYTDNISKRNSGFYVEGAVTIAWKKIQSGGLDSVVENLITLFHELRHVKQDTDKKNGKINHKKYMMVKEDVLQDLDPDYYDVNYKKIYEEIDARVSAAKEAYHFLKTLPLPQSVKEREKFVQVLERLNKIIEREKNFYLRALSKKYMGNEEADIELYFDTVIKEHPEKLEEYPILKVEYNEDGSRKSILQIFKELCTVIKHKENRIDTYDLYRYVLFSRLDTERELIEEIMKVKLPDDLPESLRRVIEKLRGALLEKSKEISENSKSRVIPGKKIRKDGISNQEIAQVARTEENLTIQDGKLIASIIPLNKYIEEK